MGEIPDDHFGGKVPDFKTEHKMVQNHTPMTQENVDPDDLTRVLPNFIPVQVTAESANAIARESSSAAKAQWDSVIPVPLARIGA